jgi:NADH-quinone oxidoreductase subunit E
MEQTTTVDLAPLKAVLAEHKNQRGSLIAVLQRAQEIYGWLPQEALELIAQELKVTMSQVYGVVTFYAQFYLSRRGQHIVRQCDGTACHVRGSGVIVEDAEKKLKIRAGETTEDGKVTFEVVYCLGSCGLAPVAVVDSKVVGHLDSDKMATLLEQLS